MKNLEIKATSIFFDVKISFEYKGFEGVVLWMVIVGKDEEGDVAYDLEVQDYLDMKYQGKEVSGETYIQLKGALKKVGIIENLHNEINLHTKPEADKALEIIKAECLDIDKVLGFKFEVD